MKEIIRRKIMVTDGECASALACVRMLGQAGYEVYLASHLENPVAAASGYVKRSLNVASPWLYAQMFRRQIADFCTEVSVDFVLPVSDASVFALSGQDVENVLNAKVMLPSSELMKLGMSKILTYQRAVENGVNAIAGHVVCPDDTNDVSGRFVFPVIIRTDNRVDRDGRFLKGQTWIVRSADEFESVRLEQKSLGQRILVQSYFSGRGRGCFLLLWDGEVMCWHTHQRLAEIPWQGGVSARRRLEFDHSLLNSSLRLLDGLRATGIVMVEFRESEFPEMSSCHSSSFLVEVNARPWGSMALSAHAQIPFLCRWLDLLNGGKENFSAWGGTGRTNRRRRLTVCTSVYPGEVQHLRSVARSAVRAELNPRLAIALFIRSFVCIFNRQTVFDYYWKDDPRPALVSLRNGVSELLRRPIQKSTQFLASLTFRLFCYLRRRRNLFAFANDTSSTGKVLVVCQGNRCRSPFIEHVLKQRLGSGAIKVFSRGLDVSEATVPQRFHGVFLKFGHDPFSHAAVEVSREDVAAADLIVVMQGTQAFTLARRFGLRVLTRCSLLFDENRVPIEVADPFVLAPTAAAQVFDHLKLSAELLAERLINSASRSSATPIVQKTCSVSDPQTEGSICTPKPNAH
jgi:protein-tyrosine phosphatase